MKQKLLFVSVLFLLFIQFSKAQSTSGDYLVRATTGVSGSSTTITINSKKYVIQQSIGQASVIGKFQSNGIVARQGFIQPPIISSKVLPEETNLEAIIYPNPVNNLVNVTFNQPISETLSIQIFDMLGRSVFIKQMNAAQQISVDLSFLANATYIFLIKNGQKQFKSKLIKQ